MKNRMRTLVVCAVLFFVLGAAYLITGLLRDKDDDTDPGEIISDPVHDFVWREFEELESITYLALDEEPITFVKNGEGVWVASGREHLKIEQEAVLLAAQDFCKLSATEKLSESVENPAEYGLEPSKLTVTAQFTDGTTETINIGDMTINKDCYYVMEPGDSALYMTVINNVTRLFWDFDMYIDRTLPVIDGYKVTYAYIGVRGSDPIEMAEAIVEREESEFADVFGYSVMDMMSPVANIPVYTESMVYTCINAVNQLYLNALVEIEPADLSEYGLDDPYMKLIFRGEEGLNYNLVIGDDSDETGNYAYCMFEGIDGVYLIENYLLDDLRAVKPFDMIYKFISLFNLQRVVRIEAMLSGVYYDMKIDHTIIPAETEDGVDEDIISVEVNGQSVQDKAFRAFFTELLLLSYESYIEQTAPQGSPDEWVIYYFDEGKEPVKNEYYNYNTSFYGVSVDGGDISFLISKQYLKEVYNSMLELLSGEMDR